MMLMITSGSNDFIAPPFFSAERGSETGKRATFFARNGFALRSVFPTTKQNGLGK